MLAACGSSPAVLPAAHATPAPNLPMHGAVDATWQGTAVEAVPSTGAQEAQQKAASTGSLVDEQQEGVLSSAVAEELLLRVRAWQEATQAAAGGSRSQDDRNLGMPDERLLQLLLQALADGSLAQLQQQQQRSAGGSAAAASAATHSAESSHEQPLSPSSSPACSGTTSSTLCLECRAEQRRPSSSALCEDCQHGRAPLHKCAVSLSSSHDDYPHGTGPAWVMPPGVAHGSQIRRASIAGRSSRAAARLQLDARLRQLRHGSRHDALGRGASLPAVRLGGVPPEQVTHAAWEGALDNLAHESYAAAAVQPGMGIPQPAEQHMQSMGSEEQQWEAYKAAQHMAPAPFNRAARDMHGVKAQPDGGHDTHRTHIERQHLLYRAGPSSRSANAPLQQASVGEQFHGTLFIRTPSMRPV